MTKRGILERTLVGNWQNQNNPSGVQLIAVYQCCFVVFCLCLLLTNVPWLYKMLILEDAG